MLAVLPCLQQLHSAVLQPFDSVHQWQNCMINALEDLFKGVFMQFTATTGLRLTDRIPVIDALL